MPTENPEADDRDDVSAEDLSSKYASALKTVLREMTSVYSADSDMIPIRFGNGSCADLSGDWIQVDPESLSGLDRDLSGPEMLRVLDSTTCHEVAHVNWSQLDIKCDVADQFPGWGDVPGTIANVLEDQYVDARRCREWYGMRSKSAFSTALFMDDDEAHPPIDVLYGEAGIGNAMIEGLSQLAYAGHLKYKNQIPMTVAEFLTDVEPIVERIRTQDDRDDRRVLIYAATQMYIDHLPDEDHPEMGGSPNVQAPTEVRGKQPPIAPAAPGDGNTAEEPTDPDVADAVDDILDEMDTFDNVDVDEEADDITIQTRQVIDDPDPDAEDPDDEDEDGMDDPAMDAIADLYDVNVEAIDTIDLRERRRWEQLVKRLEEYDSDIEQRQRERDARIDPGEFKDEETSAALKRDAENRGLIDDLRDGFAQLVTRPSPEPAQSGPQMDPANVVRRAAGDVTVDRLFENERIVETGDRCIGICCDASGSMSSAMTEVKTAAACIAEATDIIDDEFVFTSHTDGGTSSGTPRTLHLNIVTGPDESFEWRHLDALEADGGTPTPAGVRDTRVLMDEVDAREYVMIVICDGSANTTEDGYSPGDNTPVEQAAKAVRECRDDGIEVIGLGFGSINHEKMAETFGEGNFKKTTIDQLTDDILQLYRQRMDVSR